MKNLLKSCVSLALLCATLTFSQGNAHLGARAAAGISALRHHVAIPLPDGSHAIRINPAFSVGAGIAYAYDINSLVSVAPEFQYTLYRANGRFVKNTGGTFAEMNEAGVAMHSLELPILARFRFGNLGFGNFYAEAGPQIGANLDANIYANSELKSQFEKPEDMNIFAFGPAIGGGVNISGVLIGVRCYFGILEYAENTNGYPWAAQVSLTKFFF
jgi:hypothetical protein